MSRLPNIVDADIAARLGEVRPEWRSRDQIALLLPEMAPSEVGAALARMARRGLLITQGKSPGLRYNLPLEKRTEPLVVETMQARPAADEFVVHLPAEHQEKVEPAVKLVTPPRLSHPRPTWECVMEALGTATTPLSVFDLVALTDKGVAQVAGACLHLTQRGLLRRSISEANRYQYERVTTADVAAKEPAISDWVPDPEPIPPAKIADPAPLPKPAVLRDLLLSSAARSESALSAYLTHKADPVLNALVSASQMSWRACAAAGVVQ